MDMVLMYSPRIIKRFFDTLNNAYFLIDPEHYSENSARSKAEQREFILRFNSLNSEEQHKIILEMCDCFSDNEY